ncbi:helix-turn-helix domain-containing protein [Pedobacter sp. MC2016-24]|uniref:winged helix-turn-helix transcriptional regulator n=1 Tax=Pedobacter sp. MC2016-24 TaxID=2780090 RepID=UPI00187FAF59|nr:helix-turn-helix domain-containing protein [Pedobacter sp. MC2016-24]MBE9602377.1 helix-turn-helix transcriptional regulator [Pedobacter sp. MC2016-24]
MKAIVDEQIPNREKCLSNVNAIRDALFVLNGKWKLPLIFTLLERSQRFNEIQQSVQGITPKILSKELKDLEENGFVKRCVYPTTPVTVIYEITPYSDTLKSVLHELYLWGTQHRDMIRESMRKKKDVS